MRLPTFQLKPYAVGISFKNRIGLDSSLFSMRSAIEEDRKQPRDGISYGH
ncbi:MAG: hypothetical protein JRI88_04965 [Deltaproteobacteria bacterium]|nr:hypothetical protein [Deltaproteobacteria bacterium]